MLISNFAMKVKAVKFFFMEIKRNFNIGTAYFDQAGLPSGRT